MQNKIHENNDESTLNLTRFLQSGIDKLNLTIPKSAQEKIIEYVILLHKWNKIHNLTAVRDLNSMLIRHIFDSLAVVPFIKGPNILDFGTGAGLPGIPLAIAMPEWNFVLLDSSNKKTIFLRHVLLTLGLKNVEIVTKRIEEFRFDPGFATIVTRATTRVDEILEKIEHLCNKQSQALIMKGKCPAWELRNVVQAVEVLPVKVPYLDEERHVVKVLMTNYGNKNNSNN